MNATPNQDIFQAIFQKQQQHYTNKSNTPLPVHHPKALYIGCIDARLDPIDDIGIAKGDALIFRNIGAIVRKAPDRPVGEVLDTTMIQNNEVPENISLGAALEFFINHATPTPGQPKHIIVAGHTDCGGIKCCLGHVQLTPEDSYLSRYLSALTDIKNEVLKLFGKEPDVKQQYELEKASVENSINNLMSYDVVRDAVKTGKVELHGWVINTANSQIEEYKPAERKFAPFTEIHKDKYKARYSQDTGTKPIAI